MAEQKTVKKSFFSIKEAVGVGFEKAKKNFFFYVVLFLLVIAVYILYFILQFALVAFMKETGGALISIVNWVLSAIISMGLINVTLKVLDNKKPQYKDVFFTDWKLIFVYVVSNLMRGIAVAVGLLLFIIPGIILAIKLQYIEYFIVDKKMGFEAINKSWEITRGVKLRLFLFGIVLALINMLGFLALFLGLFLTVPLTMLASAYVYRKLSSN